MVSVEFNSDRQITSPYGFYGRLKSVFPSQIIVDSTEVCNLACIHCTHSQFKKSKYYAGRAIDPELNIKMVDEVRQHGRGHTQYIRYTGNGEPLMLTHIFEMLEYAVKNSGVTVTLTTNGTLLNEKHIERLLATGVNVVDISIDAFTPETYARIRVNGDLKVTRANTLRLLKMSKLSGGRTKVVVSYVEQPQNTHETQVFKSFWKDNGADYIIIRRLHSNAGSLINASSISGGLDMGEARRPCLYPWERIMLDPQGQVAFCPIDWVNGSVIADYRTTTIYETWQGEFYKKLRQAHLANEFANYKFCEKCPDWKTTRWSHEGRSYANMIEDFTANE